MNSQSIEFDRVKKDSPLPKIVRKSFRIPVEDQINIWIKINHTPYPVQDIGIDGLSIAVKDSLTFFVDQNVSNCELHYFDAALQNLNGRIVHISAAVGQDWKYGIQWEGLEKAVSDRILSIVCEMKAQLLKKDQDPVDTI
ncbi:MAG: hypothetical protein NDI81_17590 [Desulfobacula sp.]|nr:hypothetical protein [Desulfobacula sp.]MDA8133725.1 hypothetical protein [Desulfobacteraceae bacterium]